MIENLSVKNFKSIKDLQIECKQINLFIGEPNAGKSNILEALGLLSWCYYRRSLKEYVRFQGVQNLFYDDLLEQPVEIKSDKFIINIKFQDDIFNFEITDLRDGEINRDCRKST